MKNKKVLTISAVILLVSLSALLFFLRNESPAEQNKKMTAYQKLASKSDLVVVGEVLSVDFKEEIFGWVGNEPRYATFQYITVMIDRIIRGTPKADPLVIQATASFLEDPKFSPNERIVLMLRWWEDVNHGNYYALAGSRVAGKFSIFEQNSGDQVISPALMGEDWKMNLDEFIREIQLTE